VHIHDIYYIGKGINVTEKSANAKVVCIFQETFSSRCKTIKKFAANLQIHHRSKLKITAYFQWKKSCI